jgi:hypothetical protein
MTNSFPVRTLAAVAAIDLNRRRRRHLQRPAAGLHAAIREVRDRRRLLRIAARPQMRQRPWCPPAAEVTARAMVRALAFACSLSMGMFACGGDGTREPQAPASRAESAFDRALRDARAKRAALDALVPPAYSDDGSEGAAKAYFSRALGSWFGSARPRWQAMIAAYDAAASATPADNVKVEVIAEAVEASDALVQRALMAMLQMVPPSVANDPRLREHYRTQLELTLESLAKWKQSALERCVERAKEGAVQSPAADRCRAALEQVRGARIAAAPAPAKRKPDPPPPPWIPTSQPEPCVFAGSFEPGLATVYANPTGDAAIARFTQWSTVRIDRLELAATRGGRSRVVLASPLRGSGWIEEAVRPFELPQHLELAPGRVWFDPGTRASAWASASGSASLSAVLPGMRTPEQLAEASRYRGPQIEEEPDIDMRMREASATWSCSALRLAGTDKRAPGYDEHAEYVVLKGDRWVTLYEDAGGARPVTRVRGWSRARVVGRAGAFVHVERHGKQFAFDAWVRTVDVDKDTQEKLAILAAFGRKGDWYRTAKGATASVRLAPDSTALAPWTLAPDAPVQFVRSVDGFFEVDLPGTFADDGPRYFVERAAVEPWTP